MQDEKADTGEENESPQPGGKLAHQAPADEVGEPDFPQGDEQGGDPGAPGRHPQELVPQQVEPVEQLRLVQVGRPVEGGAQPGPRRQHLLGDQGVHGLRPPAGGAARRGAGINPDRAAPGWRRSSGGRRTGIGSGGVPRRHTHGSSLYVHGGIGARSKEADIPLTLFRRGRPGRWPAMLYPMAVITHRMIMNASLANRARCCPTPSSEIPPEHGPDIRQAADLAHHRGLEPGMHHALGAARVPAHPVVLPPGLAHHVGKRGVVDVQDLVAGGPPAHGIAGGVGPGGALVVPFPPEKAQVQRRAEELEIVAVGG